jgi:EAL domain-containing protein (putative c-di-GMP-specific phosphodiesterase class I)
MPSNAIKQRLQLKLAGNAAEITLSRLTVNDSAAAACFRGLALASHFQPIFSLAHQRVVGYEGLLRCTDRNHAAIAPLDAFARCRREGEASTMDRLCSAMHLRNFVERAPGDTWLFLNVNPRVIETSASHDASFGELLDRLGIPACRVVVEIPGTAGPSEEIFKSWVDHYRGLGCLIALDDFGAGHSNFDRVWRMRPDIVKLDRSMIQEAAANPGVRLVLQRIVALLHDAGALVLLDGIETGREAMIAMDTEADLVQGYYFSRPALEPAPTQAHGITFTRLYDQYRELAARRNERRQKTIKSYQQALARAAGQLLAGAALEDACAEFLALPKTRRCFLLDAAGAQIGEGILAPHEQSKEDPRLAPLRKADGANWLRRHYFRRAIAEQGKVHVTRPYFSLTDAAHCVTLSVALQTDGELKVLCADLVVSVVDTTKSSRLAAMVAPKEMDLVRPATTEAVAG